MGAENITSLGFWENFWTSSEKTSSLINLAYQPPFHRLLERHIPKSNGRAIEIGCFPCNFLIYLSKKFGYFPEGIDFMGETNDTCTKNFISNRITEFKLYNADFIKWKTDNRYSLVSSFGFIEHFKNPVEVIEKHLELLESGGTLLIEVPNFRGLRGFIARFTDKENMSKHNLEVMDLQFYKTIAERYNLDVKYLGYYGLFEYSWINPCPSFSQNLVYYFFRIISKLTFKFNFQNRFFSSWIFFIARKK